MFFPVKALLSLAQLFPFPLHFPTANNVFEQMAISTLEHIN